MRRRLRPPSTTVIPREGGESSTLRLLGSIITVSEYWIARSSRAMTASVWTQTRLRVLAADFARALLRHFTLLSKRAQGRPGADLAPAVRCAKSTSRKTAQQHTGVANHSAFPPRGRIPDQKMLSNQRHAVVVSTFMSRSEGPQAKRAYINSCGARWSLTRPLRTHRFRSDTDESSII